MGSRISTQELYDRVRRNVVSSDPSDAIAVLIKSAIISADRELHEADPLYPMAWDVALYDEVRTKYPADISAVTQASPGVITAESRDPDVSSGHGFATGDIVAITNVSGMDELNFRFFQVVYISATTFSLKSLDGLRDISTASYDEYSSGGIIYHHGVILDESAVITGNDGQWSVKRVLPGVMFDEYPALTINEDEVLRRFSFGAGGMPTHWRQWRNIVNPTTPTQSLALFWYPGPGQDFSVSFRYQREVPDISTWSDTAYPFHPEYVHDFIWRGALAKLIGQVERAKRKTGEFDAVQMEVQFASYWLSQWEQDKMQAIKFSRELGGFKGGTGGIRA